MIRGNDVKIRINKNIYLLLFSLILAWATWLKYIIPVPLKSDDVTNILVILFLVFVFSNTKKCSKKILNKQFLLFCGITITSSISAYILFGQSFFSGIIVMRHMYIQYAICLPLLLLIQQKKINSDKLFESVIITIRIAVTLYVLHYLLYTIVGISILNISAATYERYGSARFYFNMTMPVFLICNAFSNIYVGKKRNSNYYDIIIVLFLIMQVGKMRMTTLSCIAAIMLGLIFTKRMGLKKIIYIIGAVLVAVLICTYTSMGRDFVNILFGGLNSSSSVDSNSIRQIGRLRHITSFFKSPVFGLGYPHENCTAAMREFGTINSYMVNGTEQNIFIGDNGFFDFLYIFGLSGIVWLISFLGSYLKKSIQMMRKSSISNYFMFLIALIIDMYTEANWFFGGMLFMGILATLITTSTDKNR